MVSNCEDLRSWGGAADGTHCTARRSSCVCLSHANAVLTPKARLELGEAAPGPVGVGGQLGMPSSTVQAARRRHGARSSRPRPGHRSAAASCRHAGRGRPGGEHRRGRPNRLTDQRRRLGGARRRAAHRAGAADDAGGVDETRRGWPTRVQDDLTGKERPTGRSETDVVDLAGRQRLLGPTSGRTEAAVAGRPSTARDRAARRAAARRRLRPARPGGSDAVQFACTRRSHGPPPAEVPSAVAARSGAFPGLAPSPARRSSSSRAPSGRDGDGHRCSGSSRHGAPVVPSSNAGEGGRGRTWSSSSSTPGGRGSRRPARVERDAS